MAKEAKKVGRIHYQLSGNAIALVWYLMGFMDFIGFFAVVSDTDCGIDSGSFNALAQLGDAVATTKHQIISVHGPQNPLKPE